MFCILQEGTDVVDLIYTTPFHELGPLASDAADGSYRDLPAWTGNSNDALPCQDAELRKVYDLFASAMKTVPALNGSLFLIEGYSLQGAKAVPSDQTAFPNRAGNLLVSPLLTYAPSSTALDKKSADLRESLRQTLYEGSSQKELYTYVNYAFGDETEKN
ncbi:hypothetical protein F5Y01DRAFT_311972 [Xylaria sp. FL0043]|nr:hypothetical protein F5Y01DRAFT_311972 [Xylaria sp. FL0043]